MATQLWVVPVRGRNAHARPTTPPHKVSYSTPNIRNKTKPTHHQPTSTTNDCHPVLPPPPPDPHHYTTTPPPPHAPLCRWIDPTHAHAMSPNPSIDISIPPPIHLDRLQHAALLVVSITNPTPPAPAAAAATVLAARAAAGAA